MTPSVRLSPHYYKSGPTPIGCPIPTPAAAWIGARIHLVQATLGHASVATTGRSLHADPPTAQHNTSGVTPRMVRVPVSEQTDNRRETTPGGAPVRRGEQREAASMESFSQATGGPRRRWPSPAANPLLRAGNSAGTAQN